MFRYYAVAWGVWGLLFVVPVVVAGLGFNLFESWTSGERMVVGFLWGSFSMIFGFLFADRVCG